MVVYITASPPEMAGDIRGYRADATGRLQPPPHGHGPTRPRRVRRGRMATIARPPVGESDVGDAIEFGVDGKPSAARDPRVMGRRLGRQQVRALQLSGRRLI